MAVAVSLERTDREITELYQRHVDTVYRVCYSYMKNRADTEDMVQDTFIKLISSGVCFQSTEHEKAWLIVTASNLCKNALRHWWRRRENIDDYTDLGREDSPPDTVMEAITKLPVIYKDAVYLYYYEGYTTPEIADMLNCSQSTIRNRLMRARNLLKTILGGEFDEPKRNTQSL